MRLVLFLLSILAPMAARGHSANGAPHLHLTPAPMASPTLSVAPVALAIVAFVCFLAGMLVVLARWHSTARAALALAGIGMSVACFAPVIPVPHSFSNGEPADAGQVNANFDEGVQQIANHADDAALHPDSIEQLGGGTVTCSTQIIGDLSTTLGFTGRPAAITRISTGTESCGVNTVMSGSLAIDVGP